MRRQGRQRGQIIPVLAACFTAGAIAGWIAHARLEPPLPRSADAWSSRPVPMIGAAEATATAALPPRRDAVEVLQERTLRLPIDGMPIDAMKGQFEDRRDNDRRGHEAVDILAPRWTPVHAVQDGTIEKLFFSKAGGTTIYQFDPTRRFCYYYAHLQSYAGNLREGMTVSAGDIIGYVGTTGNAPPGTPHLHFAVFELTNERQWWKGKAIDPYLVFRKDASPRQNAQG